MGGVYCFGDGKFDEDAVVEALTLRYADREWARRVTPVFLRMVESSPRASMLLKRKRPTFEQNRMPDLIIDMLARAITVSDGQGTGKDAPHGEQHGTH